MSALGSPGRRRRSERRATQRAGEPRAWLLGAHDEDVAVDVLENRHRGAVLAERVLDELDAFRFQIARGRLDVVAPEADALHPAGRERVAEPEQDDAGLRAGNAEFDPAL